MSAPRKRCMVAFATREREYLWPLELPASATIAEALAAARVVNDAGEAAPVPWETAAVGVFGEERARSEVFGDGDRIELYRELLHDPRARRRARVAQARRGRG